VHQNLLAWSGGYTLTSLTLARLVRDIALRDLPAARNSPRGATARAARDPASSDISFRLDDAVREVRDYLSADCGQDIGPDVASRPPRHILERSARAMKLSELLQRHVAQTAHALHSAAEDTAALLERGRACSASRAASTIRPRSSSGGPWPIRPGTWRSTGSSRRDLTCSERKRP